MIRKKDAPQKPIKFMGHGLCDNFSKSVSLHEPTQNHLVIFHHCLHILKSQSIKPSDFRGIGIQMTKLCDMNGGANSFSTKTLFDFATVVPTHESRKQQQQQQSQQQQHLFAYSLKTNKQTMNIQRFLQHVNPEDTELIRKKLPPLPNVSLGVDERQILANNFQVSLFLCCVIKPFENYHQSFYFLLFTKQ